MCIDDTLNALVSLNVEDTDVPMPINGKHPRRKLKRVRKDIAILLVRVIQVAADFLGTSSLR